MAHGGHAIREEDVPRRFVGRREDGKGTPPAGGAYFFGNYSGLVEVAENVNGELIVRSSELSPGWKSCGTISNTVFPGTARRTKSFPRNHISTQAMIQ